MRSKWEPPRFAETVVGVAVLVGSLLCCNVSLAAVGLSLLMGLYIERFGWENKLTRSGLVICFLGIPLQIFLNFTLNNRIPGLPPLIFSLHL